MVGRAEEVEGNRKIRSALLCTSVIFFEPLVIFWLYYFTDLHTVPFFLFT
jgi:hypothetical protein